MRGCFNERGELRNAIPMPTLGIEDPPARQALHDAIALTGSRSIEAERVRGDALLLEPSPEFLKIERCILRHSSAWFGDVRLTILPFSDLAPS